MKRTHCGACESARLNTFLRLAATPLADTFPTSPAAEQKRYPVGAAHCETCGLVQLTEVVPDDELWAGDYGYFTGSSPSAVTYFKRYAADLDDLLVATYAGPKLPAFVVEVACNDGTMLQPLAAAGYRTLGIEPAKGPADAARERGLTVVGELFTERTAGRVVAEHGKADLVIANNVLAHVADLADFVGGLAVLLAPRGVLAIEVQYLGDLVLGNGFDHLYHEHRSFFSLASLKHVLAQHGLFVERVQRTAGQGGSLRVLAGAVEPDGSVPAFLESEEWLRQDDQLWSMQGRVEAIRDRILDLIWAERALGRTVVGYGASAKSCTMLNYLSVGPGLIPFVVDTTPAKIGRFTPGTGIPIVAPDGVHHLDPAELSYLLLVHNYLPGVLRREQQFLAAGGRFIVPLPVPVVI